MGFPGDARVEAVRFTDLGSGEEWTGSDARLDVSQLGARADRTRRQDRVARLHRQPVARQGGHIQPHHAACIRRQADGGDIGVQQGRDACRFGEIGLVAIAEMSRQIVLPGFGELKPARIEPAWPQTQQRPIVGCGFPSFVIDPGTGFDQGLVSAQLDASTVDIVINNTGPNPANGTLDVKLNCFQIDPAIVPDPTFP